MIYKGLGTEPLLAINLSPSYPPIDTPENAHHAPPSPSPHSSAPHSLFLHTRDTHPHPYRSHNAHPVEDSFHRRNLEHKKAMKKELDGWMDLLMESESVSREVFKRASLYLRPTDYTEITHERHLTSLCSYPLCPLPPSRKFSSASRYTFIRQPQPTSPSNKTAASSSNNGSNSGRQLVEQEDGNTHEGFCTPHHHTLSNFYLSQLSESPPWAREDLRPGDLGRFKSRARGEEGLEGRLRGREGRLGDEVLEGVGEGEVEEGGGKVGGMEKKELVVETRREYSSFEEELNKTLEGLRVVERNSRGEIDLPTASPEDKNKSPTPSPNNRQNAPTPTLHPLPHELLPPSQSPDQPYTPSRSRAMIEAGYEEFTESDEEDEEVRRGFEEAMEARELLRGVGEF